MKRGTRTQWAERVRRWRSSGLTASAFAARERLNARTLAWWSSKLRRDAQPAAAFIEVALAPVGGRRRVLWWDKNGYCLLYKRLHRACSACRPTCRRSERRCRSPQTRCLASSDTTPRTDANRNDPIGPYGHRGPLTGNGVLLLRTQAELSITGWKPPKTISPAWLKAPLPNVP